MITTVRVVCFTILLSAFPFRTGAEDFTNAIHAYLQQRIEDEKVNGGIVVGIVDEHGSSVISYGKLDNDTNQEVNGDTVFGLHSTTGTFTRLLLQDMVERGEMKLDDPVAKYLPKSVKMPTRNGKEITLRHLAAETSGLPRRFYGNLDPKRADNPLANYTVEKMYVFLSGYQLTCDPGTKFAHGSVGMGLLGQAMALKAGTDFESLMVDRICRPLKMDSTRFTLTPELKCRLATEHNQLGYARPSMDWGALEPLAGLYSTANDLLKFVSAFDLTPFSLTPLMEKSLGDGGQSAADAERSLTAPQPRILVYFGGGGFGCSSFACFDKTLRRGVVVLSTSDDIDGNLGIFLLGSEWQSDRRPKETKISSQVYGSYVGQYQRSPDSAQRMLMMRQFFLNAPKAVIYIPAGFCLAVVVVLLWRAGSFRKRCIILGCAFLVSGVLATLFALVLSHVVCTRFASSQSGIGIRHEGDRLFAQATGPKSWPVDPLLPPGAGELLPESETRFFERLSGTPMTFSRDDRGKVTGLTMDYQGNTFSYEKISDELPKLPEAPKPRVAVKLDTKLLDAIVGQYEFPPKAPSSTVGKVTIWREGDQLIGQVWDENVMQGIFDIYPESETNFFLKLDGAQLTFIKNDKGEVTAVIHHSSQAGVPDGVGKKVKNSSE
ncbi:MAG: serine hydrolase [Thermoguttaceae bacterium]|jgi:CubicO group peptidase (beta-lactamase class C family)